MWVDGGEVKEVARYLKEDPRVTAIAEGLIQRNQTLEDLTELSKTLKGRAGLHVLFMPKIIVPLSDDTPRQRIPVMTISIIILCTLIFISQILFIADQSSFFQRFGLIPKQFLSIGLISSIFLH